MRKEHKGEHLLFYEGGREERTEEAPLWSMRNAYALIMKRKLNNASTERVEGEDNNGQTTEIALKVISDKIVMDKQRKKSTEPELKVIPNKILQ